MAHRFVDIDDYVRTFPDEVRTRLEQVRQTIHQAVPGAGEKISYQIPTITLDDRSLVHFAGWKHHVSLYPVPEGDDTLTHDLSPYLSGKSTVRLPHDAPLPSDLVARVASALVDQRDQRDDALE
ncbi:MAG: DUF1801 domain-containing protein [Nocardioidaceae bacterium]|nr:DUF1801 domain-containing protein [Nocardioidaceae bacterium]